MGTIVITGASGGLGRRVAELVPDAIRVTRTPEKLDGVGASEVRPGDFTDPSSLDAAFTGAETLLLISTDVVGVRLEQHQNAVDAAVRAGVKRVVYTSITSPDPDSPLILAREHFATEQMLRDSGLQWTFLRNSIYADMQPATAAQAREHGAYVTNSGDGRLPYVAREDCAQVAAAVLTGEGHENVAYDVTGPDLLSADDLGALYGVPVQQVDDAAYADGLRAAGLPDFVVDLYVTMGAETRAGKFDVESDAVKRLTGREPQPVSALL
jgi:NAD(P)H dehydrogenase (quinone)